MLTALAELAARRPRHVLAATLLVAAIAAVVGRSAQDSLDPFRAEDPSSESAEAAERLEEAAGFDPDAGVVAVVDLGGTEVQSQAARDKVNLVADTIFRDDSIGWVSTVYSRRGNRSMLSRDGGSTYVVGHFESLSARSQQDGAERLIDKLSEVPGVKLTGFGPVNVEVAELAAEDLARAELFAFPLLLLLAFWFFRSFVAALLPIVLGGLAIVFTLFALRLVSEAVPISIFALNLVIALGLGLAIDYSLLIVSRYREELARGLDRGAALRETMASAGRTVLFSCVTVTAVMAVLLIFPQRFLYSMGIGGMAVALIAGVGALLVLPAALALLGDRVNALAPRRLQRAAERDARPASSGPWYRLARLIMRRPGAIAFVSAALMVALAVPAFGMTFTAPDTDVLPAGSPARQAREALTNDFPPNTTQPIYALASEGIRGGRVDAYAERLRGLPGVAAVDLPFEVYEDVSVIRIVSEADSYEEASRELVRDVRAVPARFEVLVGGQTADFLDSQDTLADRLPLALALLAFATLVPIFLLTRSLLLPVKTFVLNLLTVGAMLGTLVLVFQEGRLEGLLDYDSRGALGSSQALVLIALGFGLATDYGIFLLSRIKEARDAGLPDREAVAAGLERSGRIVTAAALLFCVAMGAIATSEIVFVKEAGTGAVLAVLLDATIVRALLLPSLMELFGRWNWWSPVGGPSGESGAGGVRRPA